jgi:hypothetical protein
MIYTGTRFDRQQLDSVQSIAGYDKVEPCGHFFTVSTLGNCRSKYSLISTRFAGKLSKYRYCQLNKVLSTILTCRNCIFYNMIESHVTYRN